MKGKRLLLLAPLLAVLAMAGPASAGPAVQWFHWDACQAVFEWSVDDTAADGWTVAYHAGGAVIWASPFVANGGGGLYSTPASSGFEAPGAVLCEHVGEIVNCDLTATEVCDLASKAGKGRRG